MPRFKGGEEILKFMLKEYDVRVSWFQLALSMGQSQAYVNKAIN
jgi:hypothetical protein